MLEHKITIKAYDPEAMENAKDINNLAQDADVLVVLTEWNEFRDIDLKYFASKMRTKKILDFRNILNKNDALALGFSYTKILNFTNL